MAINHWPLSERPRERLLQAGAQVLSDAELLAIFLRTGSAGQSAVDLARTLITEFGSLGDLLEAPQAQVCQLPGMGPSKYAQLQAVKELGLRLTREQLQDPQSMASSQQVGAYLSQRLGHYQREVFAVLLLDNQHRLLQFLELFQGTIDSASVHPREVVKVALQYNAAAMILAHNHPSGVAEPSQSDRLITDTLIGALDMVGVRVLDHLVVGRKQWVSFADRGWL
ncbi:MAG: DNA repair protein RadC [Gammaproteobacteria bacterium]|jgi:DNA repair protein RadC|nr:DNA repair protein RadC [Gammaproteobacteria bacterium]